MGNGFENFPLSFYGPADISAKRCNSSQGNELHLSAVGAHLKSFLFINQTVNPSLNTSPPSSPALVKIPMRIIRTCIIFMMLSRAILYTHYLDCSLAHKLSVTMSNLILEITGSRIGSGSK